MDTTKKIKALKRLIDQSSQSPVRDSSDPVFKTWKNTVERTLIRVFGEASPELAQFKQLRFFYQAIVMTLGDDYSHEHRQCFERDFKVLVSSINNYIEELEQDGEASQNDAAGSERRVRRVFISHASQDSGIVEELVELLEIIGLNHEHIFCTSFAGYGIDLGENCLDAIKDELINNDVLVLFVLTHHFYASPICLCDNPASPI